MNNNKYNCIVICGPTASGKTKLAVQVARQLNGEILSADSRQVYRGMDIGTGKDLQEYGEAGRGGFVPYHLIDIADPRQIYTLYDYQRDFYRAFEDVSARGRLPVAAGGSGLYIEAVIKGYDIPPVPENVEFRKSMMAEERGTLIDMLRSESPDIFAKTDISTKKRVIRALEVVRFGGKQAARNLNLARLGCAQLTNSTDSARFDEKFPNITPIIIYVVWERQELRARIEKRLHERLAGGLIEEAARLIDSGIDAARFALFGMEYKHAARCIRGEVSREEMAARLLQDIFHLAKRQDTWFRGMERRGMRVRTVPRAELDAALRILRG